MIAAAIGAMALQQFGTDMNRYLQRKSDLNVMKQQQDYNRDLMEYQSSMARTNYMDSADLTARGLEKAGINPAAAYSNGSPAPVGGGSIGSTPSHSGAFPGSNFNAVLLQNQMAQTKNLEAQTANIEANTQKTQIENENAQGANAAVKDSLLHLPA